MWIHAHTSLQYTANEKKIALNIFEEICDQSEWQIIN